MPKGNDGRLPWRRLLPLCISALVALAAIALAAGCGNSDKAGSGTTTAAAAARRVVQVEPVKQDRWTYARGRFREMCAGCHTLADAGARGRRFDLDRSGAQGVEETHVRYTIARGEPGMPAWGDVLAKREYEELVSYIVAVTRKIQGGNDRWHDQIEMRGEGAYWSRDKTARLEAYARRLAARREG